MSREVLVEVKINSTDITGYITKEALSVTYTDCASDDSDDISISAHNKSKKWLAKWKPQEGATLQAKIIKTEPSGKLNCGKFIIDDVAARGWPLTADIRGIAMPANEEFSDTPKSRTWAKATIKEVASTIAGNSKIPLLYDAKYNPVISFVSQKKQSDKEFLYEFCSKYGLTMKMYANRIVIYDAVEKEQKKSVMTLKSTSMLDFDAHSSITDTGYGSCVVKYKSTNGKVLEHKYAIQGKTKKVYTHTETVETYDIAVRLAPAILREKNMTECTFSCSMPGNTRIVSGICVSLGAEFGYYKGKFFIDKAVHEVSGDGGYKTNLEMHKVMQYA